MGKIYTGFTTLQILAEVQNMMIENKCETEQPRLARIRDGTKQGFQAENGSTH